MRYHVYNPNDSLELQVAMGLKEGFENGTLELNIEWTEHWGIMKKLTCL